MMDVGLPPLGIQPQLAQAALRFAAHLADSSPLPEDSRMTARERSATHLAIPLQRSTADLRRLRTQLIIQG